MLVSALAGHRDIYMGACVCPSTIISSKPNNDISVYIFQEV
jgi:hypothetical protein